MCPEGYTLSFWVKFRPGWHLKKNVLMNGVITNNGPMIIALEKATPTSKELTWRAVVKTTTGEWKAEAKGRDALRWLQVALSFDSKTGVKLYIDGKLFASSSVKKPRNTDGNLIL